MKKLIRLLCLIMAVITCVAVFAACNNAGSSAGTGGETTTRYPHW